MFLAELLTPHSICSAEKNFETKGFFSKQICLTFFSAFEWRNSGFKGRTFQQGCQKQNPRDQRNFLVKLYLEEDTTLCLLMVVLRKIWFAKRLNVRQYGILRVQWNILRDEILEETKPFELLGSERECFGFLAQRSWQSCQYCTPCDQNNFWSILNCFSKKMQF